MERLVFNKKAVALTTIFLFTCINAFQSYGAVVIESNSQTFSENSTICGNVTDIETLEPIYYAILDFYIQDDQGSQYHYDTVSNETGYYIIENVAAGWCLEYGASANGYHFYWSGNFYILENETVWVNISMCPYQPETSQVCGYVYDNYTGEPIFNATIYMKWSDIHWQLNYNGTKSDENGFFSINIGAGRFIVDTYLDAYINQGVGWININDYEICWVNFSLDPEIIIEIIKPQNGMYYKNEMILPFCLPLIIGSVDIKINVSWFDGNPIDHVEILIDNTSKYNFTTEPYIYHWDKKQFLKFWYEIEVIVHRNSDSSAIKKFKVLRFF